jgi:hypothetical protein
MQEYIVWVPYFCASCLQTLRGIWECRFGEERRGQKGMHKRDLSFCPNPVELRLNICYCLHWVNWEFRGFKDLLGCWARCKAREVVFVHPICGHEYFLRGSVVARTYPILPSSPFSFLRGCLYRLTSLVSCGAVAPIVLRCGIDLLYYNHLPHCAPNSPGLFPDSSGSQKNVSSRSQLETSVVLNFLFFLSDLAEYQQQQQLDNSRASSI